MINTKDGGIKIRIAIVIITFLAVAAAIFLFLDIRQKNQETNIRKALEISEMGLQVALMRIRNEPSFSGIIPKTECEKGWYKIKITRDEKKDTTVFKIESLGHIGFISRKQECILLLVINQQDSMWIRKDIK
jgi:type II secretory pathway component PulK